MGIAVTTREGMVTNIAQARDMTLTALRSLEKRLEFDMTKNQFDAFSMGGHQMHGGVQWRPLSPTTVAIKAKLGYAQPAAPLIRSGRMSVSSRVKVQLSSTAGGVQYRIWAWNETPYSGYHMKPSWNHWSGSFNPVRKPVSITGEDLAYAIALIEGAMLQAKDMPGSKSGMVPKALKRWWQSGKDMLGSFFGFLRK